MVVLDEVVGDSNFSHGGLIVGFHEETTGVTEDLRLKNQDTINFSSDNIDFCTSVHGSNTHQKTRSLNISSR